MPDVSCPVAAYSTCADCVRAVWGGIQVDSPSTMHVHVDQMWGDLFNTRTGVKTTMMRALASVPMSIMLFVCIAVVFVTLCAPPPL